MTCASTTHVNLEHPHSQRSGHTRSQCALGDCSAHPALTQRRHLQAQKRENRLHRAMGIPHGYTASGFRRGACFTSAEVAPVLVTEREGDWASSRRVTSADQPRWERRRISRSMTAARDASTPSAAMHRSTRSGASTSRSMAFSASVRAASPYAPAAFLSADATSCARGRTIARSVMLTREHRHAPALREDRAAALAPRRSSRPRRYADPAARRCRAPRVG